ncbi:MAG: DUF402 domain-containing protein [bacterium]
MEMSKKAVKIRGVYSTALTRFLMDHEYTIVQPSIQIQERFRLSQKDMDRAGNRSADILIHDREDHQGVRIGADKKHAARIISLFRDHFLDMVVRPGEYGQGRRGRRNLEQAQRGKMGEVAERKTDEEVQEEGESKVQERVEKEAQEGVQEAMEIEVEFPGASKAHLDAIRARVIPTVKDHHHLKIIASSRVELAESQIQCFPSARAELEKKLREDVLLGPMRQGCLIGLVHVHPEGEELSLREGKILSLENGRLVILREFTGKDCRHGKDKNGQNGHYGRYDGLNLPIEEGDYGITEAVEHAWFLRHTYYSREGSVKGVYWNINTPIEFYPDHIRYLDLHIDVIQKPGFSPRLIDREKLDRAAAKGLISPELARQAYRVADSLLRMIARH